MFSLDNLEAMHKYDITWCSLFRFLVFIWRNITTRHHKIPLNSRCHLFDSRNGYSSVMLVKLPIFGFLVISSCNSKVSIFPKFITEFCMGRPCWMVCHPTWPPHTKLSSILEILKFWITATSPKLWLKTKNWQRDQSDWALSISGVKKVVFVI